MHQPIRFHDIALKYGKRDIFSYITTSLHAHDRVVIIGPNGAGKSTLLKALMRDIRIQKSRYW